MHTVPTQFAVTVRLTVAVCVVPPVPLAVPVTVIDCTPVGIAMLACVVMVRPTVAVGFAVVSVKLVGLLGSPGLLKVQSAPGGRPAVQLPGVELVGELVEFVKLMVALVPLVRVRVKVAVADCPAEMELGDRLLAV